MQNIPTISTTATGIPYFSILDIADIKERAVVLADSFGIDRGSALKAIISIKSEEMGRPLGALLEAIK